MAINLAKGQKIDLKKGNGGDLNSFCVGANWGMIEKKGLFGGVKKESVDLDLSVGLYDANKKLIDMVYFSKLTSAGVSHSGDDLQGDADGDDGLDNEVIEISLNRISSNVEQLMFVLNSYKGQDFATIPFAAIRLYEGTPDRVNEVVATYNVASDSKYAEYTSMILGKLYRRNGAWKFSAIGEPTKDKKLEKTLVSAQKFL
ncbi:MAG: TerD family protein [Campylobacterota bacterium]|nr:TerD family protein [Campylobacterota bacterium]